MKYAHLERNGIMLKNVTEFSKARIKMGNRVTHSIHTATTLIVVSMQMKELNRSDLLNVYFKNWYKKNQELIMVQNHMW